jgi:hypothetical protein
MYGSVQNAFRKFSAGANMIRHGLLLLGWLLVAGCATPMLAPPAADRPDWLRALPESERWLYGVGASPLGEQSASALRRARSAAIADLFTQIQLDLMAEETASAQSLWVAQPASSRVHELGAAEVQWLDDWQSPDAVVYALVGLERARAAERLRALPLQNWPQLPEQSAPVSWTQLQEWASVLSVLADQQGRDALHQWLVDTDLHPDWPAHERALTEAWQGQQRQMPIRLFLSATTPEPWASSLIQPWAAHGFVFARGDWQLRFHVTEAMQTLTDGYQVELTFDILMLDPQMDLRWQYQTQSTSRARELALAREQALQQGAEQAFSAWQQALFD